MAKYEAHLRGDFGQIVEFIHHSLWEQSASLSLEETYTNKIQERRIELRVYERFSYTGGNRASLSVLFVETEDGADLCGTATGGKHCVVLEDQYLGRVRIP